MSNAVTVIYPTKLTKLCVKCLDPHANDVVHIYLRPSALGENPVRNRDIILAVLNGETQKDAAATYGITGGVAAYIFKRFVRATMPSLAYQASPIAIARKYSGWVRKALAAYKFGEVQEAPDLTFDGKTTMFSFTRRLPSRLGEALCTRKYCVKVHPNGSWTLLAGGTRADTGPRIQASVPAAQKIIEDYIKTFSRSVGDG